MTGPDRNLALIRSSIDDVQETAHRYDAKVNDVLLAVTAGGLRELLSSAERPVEDVMLPILVPVTLRQGQRGQARGNLIGQMVVPLPVGVSDPGRRLQQIAAETAKRKARTHPPPGDLAAQPNRPLGPAEDPGSSTSEGHHRRRARTTAAGLPRRAQLLEVFPVLPLIANVSPGVGALWRCAMSAAVSSSGVPGGIVGYVLRVLRPGRNPLCRASDRVEAAAWLPATLLVLLVVPLVALHIGLQVYAASARTERAQLSDRRPTTATLIEDAPVTGSPALEAARLPGRTTRVRWTAPDGTVREGVVTALPGKEPGARLRVWLDRAGRPTRPPQSHARTVTVGVVAGFGILAAAVVGLLLLVLVIRLRLDRWRLARWGNEWKLFEARWTGRRRPEEHS